MARKTNKLCELTNKQYAALDEYKRCRKANSNAPSKTNLWAENKAKAAWDAVK